MSASNENTAASKTTRSPGRLQRILLDSAWLSMGYASYNRLPRGISFQGEHHPASVEFLCDTTYLNSEGVRCVEQQIFDQLLHIIAKARRLLILDFFLFNDFQGQVKEQHCDLCSELTHALTIQKQQFPDLVICFITDPINTIYGGTSNAYLTRLSAAGIQVVTTDLDQLRDSNAVYSFFWRLLVRPFGNNPNGWLATPFSEQQISIRSYLTLFNLKANHRKTVIADDGQGKWTGLVSTGNPHNGSSAHQNLAMKFSGPAVYDLYITERAVLEMSGTSAPLTKPADAVPPDGDLTLQVITERRIKQAILTLLDAARETDTVDMMLFYLSDRQVVSRIKAAHHRGVTIRIILDPNKDAFGMRKNGIPNRPVAYDLHRAGLAIRWADTHGEQCHSKLMLVHTAGGRSRIILGSANFTRRNLNDFNLETDVLITAERTHKVIDDTEQLFNRLWCNEADRTYTTDYETYADPGRFRYLAYWLMETTGLSTF
jgi:phosphatidylserine/phosphatidylglycerophosphate/cardiolipin synthase-like enzyme